MATTSELLAKTWQIVFGFSTLLVGLATAVFAYFQYRINSRLRDLKDYVAISIIPFVVNNNPKIQIKNSGTLNFYVHRYEVDGHNES